MDGGNGSEQLAQEGVGRLQNAARAFLGDRASFELSLLRDRQVQIATFSAFEAQRQIRRRTGTTSNWFYVLFLAVTGLSPLIVAAFPSTVRVVVWDAFGIGSTLVLLLSTYGIYTLKMAGKISGEFWHIFTYFPPDAKPDVKVIGRHIELDAKPDRGEPAAALNVFLLISAMICCAIALYELNQLYLAKIGGLSSEYYNGYYVSFFLCVLALSFLFIWMDMAVAAYDESHSESFIGASSAAHATIPMFIGVAIVGLYLLGEYIHGMLRPSTLSPDPIQSLSVEVASGALTFQMIMSNVLFIFIKKNLIFRLLYNTLKTTKRD